MYVELLLAKQGTCTRCMVSYISNTYPPIKIWFKVYNTISQIFLPINSPCLFGSAVEPPCFGKWKARVFWWSILAFSLPVFIFHCLWRLWSSNVIMHMHLNSLGRPAYEFPCSQRSSLNMFQLCQLARPRHISLLRRHYNIWFCVCIVRKGKNFVLQLLCQSPVLEISLLFQAA